MPSPDAQRLLKHFVEEDVPLRAYIFAATRNSHDTEDLLQSVWSILWRKIDQYDDRRPFRAWAFGVARLEVLKWRQRQGRSREYLTENTLELMAESATEHAADLDMRGEFLKECLKRLGDAWRHVLTLKYYQGLSIRDIADRIGKSTPAVEMILVRARRSLRACIERKIQDVEGLG